MKKIKLDKSDIFVKVYLCNKKEFIKRGKTDVAETAAGLCIPVMKNKYLGDILINLKYKNMIIETIIHESTHSIMDYFRMIHYNGGFKYYDFNEELLATLVSKLSDEIISYWRKNEKKKRIRK
jgi:hypothetical protein